MQGATRVEHPPEKPLVIFDGDCTFCRRWIARWQQTTGDRVDYVPLQSETIAAQFPEISPEQLESAVHLIEPMGRVTRGAEAVARMVAPDISWPLWCYQHVPGVAPIAEFAYRCVATNRTIFSWVTRMLWGDSVERPTHFITRRIFLFLLGFTYLIAFWSFEAQRPGLIGSRGIVPAAQVMQAVDRNTQGVGLERYWQFPTLCWIAAEDGFIRSLCLIGMALSVLVLCNIAPAPSLVLLWLIYLSLTQVSTVFLGYQWDNLLLETGLLAIFFAPGHLWPNPAREAPPSMIGLWLLRWLLFRLMFASGAVKLLSGDATWRSLTALTIHYETQPLPTPIAWYAHQLPFWFQRFSCGVMFFIELALPFLIFFPRRARRLAFWGITLLMAFIALTGNYTFFNLLTFALAVTLLDDRALARFASPKTAERVAAGLRPAWLRRWPRPFRVARGMILSLLVVVVGGATAVQMLAMAGVRWSSEHLLVRLYQTVAPFRSINSYGLFAVMTTSRPEIVVEGSADGQTWLAYEFRHKPGAVDRPPTFVAPHQPRLDWQMWFAALGDVRHNPWFVNFCSRLARNEPAVLALLKKNPFPDRPPRFIRASLYDYHFTTFAERRRTGAWWRREYKGEYCPTMSVSTGTSPPAP